MPTGPRSRPTFSRSPPSEILGLPSRDGSLHSVIEPRVPIPPAPRRVVENVVDGTQEIETALPDVLAQPRVSRVEVAHGAVGVLGEDGHRRGLTSLTVLA